MTPLRRASTSRLRRSPRRQSRFRFLVAIGIVCTSCSSNADTVAQEGKVPFDQTLWLDEKGHPYDVVPGGPIPIPRVELRVEGTLDGHGSPLMVGDGIPLLIAQEFQPEIADFTEIAGLSTAAPVRVTRVVSTTMSGSTPVSQIDSLRLDLPDAKVDAWGPFESAYGTDGGVGAVTTRDALNGKQYTTSNDVVEDIAFSNNDDKPGFDSFVFSNGFGDGGFPMTRGRSKDGQVVSVVLWTGGVPWRIMDFEGAPPKDVTDRENQLAQCLSGQRKLVNGYCP